MIQEETKRSINGKRIFVSGACGTVGKELVSQLLTNFTPKEVLGLDNNESEIFFLEQKYSDFDNFTPILGDVRDRDKLCRRTKSIDVILHCAAFKHVIMCERSPLEAVQTNVLGVQNIIYAAFENAVPKVLFTSSDKAVNPTNVMGTSKLMGERLITAANCNRQDEKPIFFSTRFGNVLGSRGSVLPIFQKQIRNGGPVTLTDERMTRFVMTVKDAARLVIETLAIGKGGEVFITKMPVIQIADLAHVMIHNVAKTLDINPTTIKIDRIGTKAGEKLYEELMNSEEVRRAIELRKYFVVLPAFRNLYRQIEYDYPEVISETVQNPYISNEDDAMSKKELTDYLKKNNLLEDFVQA